MTPYVVNDDGGGADAAKKKPPRSIMVNGQQQQNHANGAVNGGEDTTVDSAKPNGNVQDMPENGMDDVVRPLNGCGVRGSGGGSNGKAKAGALKRVSFGSSKGSMVETLVYDHPEDAPYGSVLPVVANGCPKTENRVVETIVLRPCIVDVVDDIDEVDDWVPGEDTPLKPPSKVRVTFYESQKPHFVTTPESPNLPLDFIGLPAIMSSPNGYKTTYDRQESAESGLDNPFRPDGELSREADTIVSLIKEGKPITPTKTEPDQLDLGDQVLGSKDEADHSPRSIHEDSITPTKVNAVQSAKVGANGSAPKDTSPVGSGEVEVQHGVVVPPSEASQAEQVVIKKKPKCKCCVIQ